jgi:hypothetical protein
VSSSLEPIAVLSLLRVYGYQWDSDLYIAAAEAGNWKLIKWLHQVQCPIAAIHKVAHKFCGCMSSTAVSILQWLCSLPPFNEKGEANIVNKTALLTDAGECGNLAVMQWLRRELNAEWPSVANIIRNDGAGTFVPAWPIEADNLGS